MSCSAGVKLHGVRTSCAFLRIELSPARELDFHVFPVLAFNWDFWLNLERLGRLLGSTWSVLGASWAQLGASWPPLGLNLEPLARLLGSTWALLGLPIRTPSATWRFLCATWPSKAYFKCNLAPLRLIFGALATLRDELSPARELDFRVLAT